jgi:hypothetical protein
MLLEYDNRNILSEKNWGHLLVFELSALELEIFVKFKGR